MSSKNSNVYLMLLVIVCTIGVSSTSAQEDFDDTLLGDILFESRGDIYLINADGTDLCNLTDYPDSRCIRYAYPSWSPDGSQIVFSSNRDAIGDCPDFFDDLDIFVMNADGNNVRMVANTDGWNGYPIWSPDGNRIAFLFGHIVDIDGANLRELPGSQPAVFDGGIPSWSPDGQQLAYTADNNIFIVDIPDEGPLDSHIRQITFDGKVYESYHSPAWSPNGDEILFVRSVPAPGASLFHYIHKLDVVTGEVVLLGEHGGIPSWSPDSHQIAYVDWDQGIFVMDADGSSRRHILESPVGFPEWSTDGRHIVVQTFSQDDRLTTIYIVNADGADIRELITFELNYGVAEPQWRPQPDVVEDE